MFIFNPDARVGVIYPSVRSFPGVFTAMIHGLLGSVWPGNPATNRYHASNTIRDETSEVDWVSDCCMVLPRQAWDEVGGFDERYFIYIEDMDLCFRLRKAGWRTLFEPNATVVHVGGRSSCHRPLRSIYHHHLGAIRFYRITANSAVCRDPLALGGNESAALIAAAAKEL